MKAKILQSVAPMLFVIALTPALGCAQAEINPDHFDNPGNVATVAHKTSNQTLSHAYGSFFLPLEVTCAGVKLMPGHYSVSIQQSGRRDVVRVTRLVKGVRAQAVEVIAMPRMSAEGPSGLVVDRVNRRRTLTAIRLQQPRMTLFLQTGRASAVSVSAELIPISDSTSQALPANGE